MQNSKSEIRNNKWLILVNRFVRWGIGITLIYFGGGWKGEWPVLIVGLAFFVSGFLKPRGCIGGACDNS